MSKDPTSRNKTDLTPKITLTKTTITKSAPFFIRRHHLDDTEMKYALCYDDPTLKPTQPRRYSFKAQVLTCQNSKLTAQPHTVVQSVHKVETAKVPESGDNDYYNVCSRGQGRNRENLGGKEREQEAPYFPSSGQRAVRANTGNSKGQHREKLVSRDIKKQSNRQPAKQCQDYGLKQIHNARKKMQKQAKKLRQLYKQKVEKDLQSIQNDEVTKLQQQVRTLKIQSLQFQKQKYAQELSIKLKESTQKKEPAQSDKERLKYQRAQLILNKPKYHPLVTAGDATDSSFSSFQLDSSALSDT